MAKNGDFMVFFADLGGIQPAPYFFQPIEMAQTFRVDPSGSPSDAFRWGKSDSHFKVHFWLKKQKESSITNFTKKNSQG